MSTLPGPYPVPKDSITPYKVTFDRLMRTLSELQFQADVLAENRAAGAVFDGVPFLLSMDSSERFLSIRAVWDPNGLLDVGPRRLSSGVRRFRR